MKDQIIERREINEGFEVVVINRLFSSPLRMYVTVEFVLIRRKCALRKFWGNRSFPNTWI